MSRLIEVVSHWPTLEMEIAAVGADALQPAMWQHYLTQCEDLGDVHAKRAGTTVWVSRAPSPQRAAIAWEWVELVDGVLALADPNGLVSNLCFTGPIDGLERLDTDLRKVVVLNTIVHGLNWQDRVLAEVHRAVRAGIWSGALSPLQ